MTTATTTTLSFPVSPARYRRDTAQEAAPDTVLQVTYTVYLEQLSPQARHVIAPAAAANTTGGPLPVVFVHLPADSVRSYLAQHGLPLDFSWQDHTPALLTWLTTAPMLLWRWPTLPDPDTPEAYLDNQVAQMAALGRIVPLTPPPPDDWLSVVAVAAHLGVLPREARRLCTVGLFPSAEKHDSKWRVLRRDLALPSVQNRPRGRPPLPRGAAKLGYAHPDDTAAWIAATLSEHDFQSWQACCPTAILDSLVQRFGPFRLLPAAAVGTPVALPGSPLMSVALGGPPWRVIWPG